MGRKTRKMGIRVKMSLIIGLVIISLLLIFGITIYETTKESLITMGVEQAQIAATITLRDVDANLIASLEPGDEENEDYKAQVELLRDIQEDCHVAFLYTLFTDGEQVYYGMDTDETEEQAYIGEPFEVSYEELQPVFEGEEYVQDYIDYTEYGILITAYLPIRNDQGEVIAVLGSDFDATMTVDNLNTVKRQIIIICGLGVVIAIAILYFAMNGMLRGLRKISVKIFELAQANGDLTQRLDVRTGDEIELMACDVNELLEYIQQIMIKISEHSISMKDLSNIIFQELTEAKGHVSEVSAATEEMSASMQVTSSSVNQLNDAFSQMHLYISDISEKAEKGSHMIQDVRKTSHNVRKKVHKEQKEAQQIAEELEKLLNEKIQRAHSVKEINSLTEMILKISKQINLLAYNARIEAARAGEYGKGFDVIANEIRKLAAASEDVVQSIQQISEDVILSVEDLSVEAEKMAHFLENTAMEGFRKSLIITEEYHKTIKNMTELMKNFAEDSDEVTQFSDSIRESVDTVNTAIEENTSVIVYIAEAVSKLEGGIETIEQKANVNNKIADRMGKAVEKFKL